MYNLGRVIAYTAVGFAVGGLGSAVTFSNSMQGVLKLIAGIFMVIMGINILGIFPWLRRLNPRFPTVFTYFFMKQKSRSKNPLFVGLLNGLMPCGPLQAMQLYALSTGSPIAGALSMFLFSLGTVPLMFGLGALSSVLGKKFAGKVMTAGAVLVVVLGLSMFSQGWSLSALPQVFPNSLIPKVSSAEGSITVEDNVQIVNSTLSSGSYPTITVQAGMPVKWMIDAPEGSINGCNNRMFIPEYNIEYQFNTGENVIEFMPSKTGAFSFSCWMGMIRSTISVVEPESEFPIGDNSSERGNSIQSQVPREPISANYVIPTDEIALAEQKVTYRQVTIQLTEDGFQPAVIILQANVDTEQHSIPVKYAMTLGKVIISSKEMRWYVKIVEISSRWIRLK
jgi:sulfite exporter TauE/SafE